METTDKKECPKCKNNNIVNTGKQVSDDKNNPSYPHFPESIYPIYRCRGCGEVFIFIEK